MRIGIDARELCGRSTGVGRYLTGLLAGWATASPSAGHEFVLYAPGLIELPLEAHDGRRFMTRADPGTGGTWWEQVQMPRVAAHDRLDVFFSPAYTTPLFRSIPFVVAIHDISFAAHPEWFTTREGLRRRWFARQAAGRAKAVITISEFSRREILENFKIPPARVHVIPPGITPPASIWGTHDELRVLFVGTILNRRHVPDLIRAFAPIVSAHPSATLDIVGDNRSHPRQNLQTVIAGLDLQSSVRCRDYVSNRDLADLYRHARAFAFLSEYEGLGLTPLEALAVGVPPVLLDTAVARESCGDAALYVESGDIEGTTAALTGLLFDGEVRRRLLTEAPQVLARYDWGRAARETLGVLELAAG